MILKKQRLEELASDVRQIILEAERIREISEKQFNQKRNDGGWSIAQVLEHMLFYSRFYLPHLERSLAMQKPDQKQFKSGWLGSYFTQLMKPDDNGVVKSKMKAPSNAKPQDKNYSWQTLESFIAAQHQLLQILKDMEHSDWNMRLPISISRMIRLKAGDVLQFVIAHEQRHMLQIHKMLQTV